MMKSKSLVLALTLFLVAIFSVMFAPGARATAPIVTFAGDLTGNMQSQTVQKLQNRTLTITSPTSGQALTYNGSAFVNSTIGTSNIAPGSAGTFLVTNATPAVVWSTLDTFETIHGRFQAGGGGSDYKAVLGPLIGFETNNAGLWLTPGATTLSSANVSLFSDATNTYVNAASGTGTIGLLVTGGTYLGAFNGGQSRFYVGGSTSVSPLFFDWSTTTAPFMQSGTATTYAFKDSGGVARDSFDFAHGRITAGNGGSDTFVQIGATPGSETSTASLYLLNHGATPGASNFALQSDGTSNLTFNTAASGSLYFEFGASIYASLIHSGGQGLFTLGNVVPSTANYAIASDGSSFVNVNAPSSSSIIEFTTAGSNFIEALASGTQNGVALGSTLATTGHVRGPSGLGFLLRNTGNTANNTVFQDDGSNNITYGTGYGTTSFNPSTSFTVATPGTIILEGGSDFYEDATTIHLRSAAHTEIARWGDIGQLTIDAGISFVLAHDTAAAAGNPTTINGQDAGGTAQNGGTVNVNGGAPTTTGLGGLVQLQSAGSTMIGVGQYGMALGVTSVAIAVGTNTLSAAQYKTPFIVLTGAIGGGAANIVLPNNPGRWEFDCSQVTGASTIVFKSGSATAASVTTPVGGTQQIITVSTLRGPNTIAINL